MTTAQTRNQTITATAGGTFNLPNNVTPSAVTVFDGHTGTKNQNVYGATGPFNVKFGTGHTNNVYFTSGNQAATSITGLAGDDHMYLTGTAHGTYTVNMGTGENTVSLDNAFGSMVYTNTNVAASTYDTLDLSNTSYNFTALNMLATSGAVVQVNNAPSPATVGTIADIHSMRALVLGSGNATVTLNNLDDNITFGNGNGTVTGGTGDDVYTFHNFTGAANATQSITDAAGTNTMDFSGTSSNVSVNFATAATGAAFVTGTGAGAGHSETINFAGTNGIANIIGGTGNDTYTIGNAAGAHSLNGGTGSNTLIYNGSQGVTLDVRDHDLVNAANTTNVTFHGINTYKILGGGANTIIGDGSAGTTYYLGNGTNTVDMLSGAAATVHSDMGGNTTVIMGNGYGAATVSNTASAGVLTIDASALTHTLNTVTLGAGSGSAQLDDGNGNTVTWAANSKVTGYIGNDLTTTINATGNLNFHITTGNGADTVTATGTGNSVISTGTGIDTISVGTGNNTIIFGNAGTAFGSGTQNSLTVAAGSTGSNTVFAGGGYSVEDLSITGTGADVVDFSNGGNHQLTIGLGNSTIQGFTTNNNWNVGITNDCNDASLSGTPVGTLDLSNFNSTDVTFNDQQNLAAGNKIQDLQISLDANHVITIHDYFDASTTAASTAGAGTGQIATLHFADHDLAFADVQALTVHTGVFN